MSFFVFMFLNFCEQPEEQNKRQKGFDLNRKSDRFHVFVVGMFQKNFGMSQIFFVIANDRFFTFGTFATWKIFKILKIWRFSSKIFIKRSKNFQLIFLLQKLNSKRKNILIKQVIKIKYGIISLKKNPIH